MPNKHKVILHCSTIIDSFTQLLPSGARISNCKITVYVGTEYLKNLKMQCFIIRLYTDLSGACVSTWTPQISQQELFF
jgi:hypothetical protein